MAANDNGHNGKLLVGIDKIAKYLDIGHAMFHEFRRQRPPMPVRFVGRTWIASKDNLDEYFRRFTLVDSSAVNPTDEG